MHIDNVVQQQLVRKGQDVVRVTALICIRIFHYMMPSHSMAKAVHYCRYTSRMTSVTSAVGLVVLQKVSPAQLIALFLIHADLLMG